jgi:uncharacterized protein (UPF0305 family)
VDSFKLLALLKKEAGTIAIPDSVEPEENGEEPEYRPGSIEYINRCMKKYNSEIFSEIIDSTHQIKNSQLDPDLIEEFSSRLDAYMDKHAPDRADLKKYVRVVSLYLTFIAEKPLHPPDLLMLGIDRGISRNGEYYCSGPESQKNETIFMCRYCVAYTGRGKPHEKCML